MIATVDEQFKIALAAATTWAVRWDNELWDSAISVSDGDMPIDEDGLPLPAIEARTVSQDDLGYVGSLDTKKSARVGLLQLFFSVQQGSGKTAINAEIDTVLTALKRKTIYLSGNERLITFDAMIDNNVAAYEEGNRYVRVLTIEWRFDYVS